MEGAFEVIIRRRQQRLRPTTKTMGSRMALSYSHCQSTPCRQL